MQTAGFLVPRHLRHHAAFGALLAIASLIVTLACFAPAAHAESGEYEEYDCIMCASVTSYGHLDNPVTGRTSWEVQGNNETGKGICTVFWENVPENKYVEHPDCTSTGTSASFEYFKEVWGHGEMRRWYKEYTYSFRGDVRY